MSERVSVLTNTLTTVRLFVFDCPSCGVIFGITNDYDDRRREDGRRFCCPNGHYMTYTPGKSAEAKLNESKARETALRDQLEASIRDGEAQRVELARIRQRIANGVCPCCNRSFGNVRAHMQTQHPEYAVDLPSPAKAIRFECSCGSSFTTYRGLRVHQGHLRPDYWARPSTEPWMAHLTVGATR